MNETSITVVSICFARADEVELLWLETAKVFADCANVPNVDVAKKAIFCLEVCTH
jgi:hypothetical protein